MVQWRCNQTFDEPPGSYDICPICFWEDDPVQLRWPDYPGGANSPSLIDAQDAYRSIGAKEKRVLDFVRHPRAQDRVDPGWRPVDLSVDQFEAPDRTLPWPEDTTALYWWRETFWNRPAQ